MTPKRNSHCSFCGSAYDLESAWPRTCARCASTVWLNPTPVAVLVVPVDHGVMVVRRGIEPRKGELALPGGFVNLGETWQSAAARELFEETDVVVDAAEVELLDARSPPDGKHVIIFGFVKPRRAADLPPFKGNPETLTREVVDAPVELAFPTHTDVLRTWFERDTGR